MGDMFFTHPDNQYNDYVGRRVRVVIAANNRRREKVYVGTFHAFDYFVNVVLYDVYRVILNVSEEQKQSIRGLLLIRGANIKSITLVRYEHHLPTWPTRPRDKSPKAKKTSSKKPIEKEVPTPAPTVKPLKLKRNWLATPVVNNHVVNNHVVNNHVEPSVTRAPKSDTSQEERRKEVVKKEVSSPCNEVPEKDKFEDKRKEPEVCKQSVSSSSEDELLNSDYEQDVVSTSSSSSESVMSISA